MTKRFGFTLAEVLITLGIIGVVAAMTIPTLMNQTGQAEFKTGFKKAISVLNQAITMSVALDSSDFSALNSANAAGSIYSMFTSKMNVINSTTGADATLGFGNNNYTLFLNDGMVISFPSASAACAAGTTTIGANCTMIVDVNGKKKPNKVSTMRTMGDTASLFDQFYVDFYNQQVIPLDTSGQYVLYN